jgi:hypothetical protein
MHHRFARVAVKYAAFGFAATDALAAGPGADFRTLSTTAEEIADS